MYGKARGVLAQDFGGGLRARVCGKARGRLRVSAGGKVRIWVAHLIACAHASALSGAALKSSGGRLERGAGAQEGERAGEARPRLPAMRDVAAIAEGAAKGSLGSAASQGAHQLGCNALGLSILQRITSGLYAICTSMRPHCQQPAPCAINRG